MLGQTSRLQRGFIRWHDLYRMTTAIEAACGSIFGNKTRGALRRGWGIWVTMANALERSREAMDRALDSFSDSGQRKYLHAWYLKARLSGKSLAGMRHVRHRQSSSGDLSHSLRLALMVSSVRSPLRAYRR